MRARLLTGSMFLSLGLVCVGLRPGALGQGAASAPRLDEPSAQYLGDHPELILSSSQAWGELGWNAAAHAAGKDGRPLQIGSKIYPKGLGHHANGSIQVLLDGRYASFDAVVGLEPCGAEGSVIFRVFADDEKRFDSGILRATNGPQPVHVDLAGAQELRLEANDAGDGVSCDMANWAEARLLPAGAAAGLEPRPLVDVARFARVVTWDPNRTDGARASRIEEFRAEDLFLDTNLPRQADGTYRVPVSPNGLGCIGLQWLNRRAVKELDLEFSGPSGQAGISGAQVQGWFGESAWQGSWKRLAGEVEAAGQGLVFRLSPKAGAVQTQKVRWLFRATEPMVVRRMTAFTRSSWQIVKLVVEAEGPAKGEKAELAICNGEFLSFGSRRPKEAQPEAGDSPDALPTRIHARLGQPLHLTIRASRASSFKSDPTVLEFRLPAGAFGIGIEDVLSNACVYLPDFGVFVARDPAPIRLEDYKRQIAGRKTLLEQVREQPDQTLGQAMARTHHDAQREGPVMLSLACDNVKFVVERGGTLRFQAMTNLTGDWFATAGAIRPEFGEGHSTGLARTLDGGWLPIPVVAVEEQGVGYVERTFVAPCDEPGSNPTRLNRRSVCVAEFGLTNTLAQPAGAALALRFQVDGRPDHSASLRTGPGRYCAEDEAGPFAWVNTDAAAPLAASASGGTLTLRGTLPPHTGISLAVLLPAQRGGVLDIGDPKRLRAETEAYWNAALAPAMQVETPDALLNHVIRSSQVRCLIAARNEAGGARVAPWIAAMSYGPLESEGNSVIRGMEFMGHADFARRALDFFTHRYNTNGFLTTGYTTFGTAWHLWTLGEHYQLYRDTNWLRQAAPVIERAANWMVRQTDKTTQPGRPEYGLMPPGVIADWNSFACHYAMNGYYYAALGEIGTALADLGGAPGRGDPPGLPEDLPLRTSRLALSRAAELRANILRAYRWTQAQSPALPLRDGTWIPAYPSQVHSPGKLADFFPGQDAGRSWCYDVEIGAHQLVPAGVFDPRDREVERMLAHMEDVQFLAEGWFDYPATMNEKDWFNLGGFSKVQPYYTRNCEVYALRDEVKPFVRSYFNTLAAMVNPEVLTLWEHFHHSGAWDKTHETGYFLHQTRTMLVAERGDQLWLAPFIPSDWLRDGQTLTVSNAPTRFGPVSYRIASHLAEGCIRATILPPPLRTPNRIMLRLRTPESSSIRFARLNGKPYADLDPATGLVRLKPTRGPLDVEVFLLPPRRAAPPRPDGGA